MNVQWRKMGRLALATGGRCFSLPYGCHCLRTVGRRRPVCPAGDEPNLLTPCRAEQLGRWLARPFGRRWRRR